jgi:hypothetical protein
MFPEKFLKLSIFWNIDESIVPLDRFGGVNGKNGGRRWNFMLLILWKNAA